MSTAAAIGVFDSGVGGLSVLRELQAALPHEDFLYLGDTARLPYGTKSEHTVVRYALQATDELVAREVKCLVVACNTASAAALPALRERYGLLPVIGVIDPGARAACAASLTGRIAVLATAGTVRSGAYSRAILALRADAQVTAVACALFVSLAEEGWTSGAAAEAVAERYLGALRESAGRRHDAGCSPDTVLLGCTHFPVLAPVIMATLGAGVRVIDSALTTAVSVRTQLQGRSLLRAEAARAGASVTGVVRFLATDDPERFAAVGGRFLGRAIDAATVELIDL